MAVTLGRDALSQEMIQKITQYMQSRKGDFCWSSNLMLWDESLVRSSAIVMSHKFDKQLQDEVFTELRERKILPFFPKSAVMMFYVWLPGSYITWHTDYTDKQSLTIYMHKTWDPNHGGYFCWRDWGDGIERHDWSAPPDQCKMALPRPNSYVYMTDAEWHTVSMTTPNAPPRTSLQMFFEAP